MFDNFAKCGPNFIHHGISRKTMYTPQRLLHHLQYLILLQYFNNPKTVIKFSHST